MIVLLLDTLFAMVIEQTLQIAVNYHQAGHLTEAERLYRQVLQQDPRQPDALHLLGMIARRFGHFSDAADLIRQAIAINPASPAYYGNLGLVLTEMDKLDEAVAAYQQAIFLQPNFAQAHCNLGTAYRKMGRYELAIKAFETAIQHQPHFPEAFSNLSTTLAERKDFDAAIGVINFAIEQNPISSDLHYNLGNVLSQADRLDEAITAYQQALALNAGHLNAMCDLGNAFRSKGNRNGDAQLQKRAIDCYQQAIAVDPHFAEAHWNLAITLLLHGDFDRGWVEHEWRLKIPSLSRPRTLTQPQWKGEPLAGKRILLHPEQGLGDTLQFLRYVPLVKALGAKVILECQPELFRLLQGWDAADNVIATPTETPADFQCPLMSLPLAFQTKLDSIPNTVPYLFADKSMIENWATKLGPANDRKRVGLVWAGSSVHKNDANRSMSLTHFLPLMPLKNIQLFSLQKGDAAVQATAADVAPHLINHTSQLHDFADTAALIANLDLVISVDTSVVHLAGAMGKPVWVLLPKDPDWRWLLDRSDTPWYPSMQLFRQKITGDWSGVIGDVMEKIEAW